MRTRMFIVSSALVLGVTMSAGLSLASDASDATSAVGHVYSLSNDSEANAVLVFDRAADGALVANGSLATGGKGAGASLGSSGALALSEDGNWLFAVNAGSNTVSVFGRERGSWELADVVASGGTGPVSVTERDGVVYVLNAGTTQNISGFTLEGRGKLRPIAGGSQPLSTDSVVGAAQVSWSPDGRFLLVTEKGTNTVDTFAVGGNGRALPGVFTPAVGATPYGFDFTPNGFAIVTDAAGGGANAGAATSYWLSPDGATAVGGAALALGETAPCWAAVSKDGAFAFVADTGSGMVTSLSISSSGRLSPLSESGANANTGAGSTPGDVALSPAGHHLFVLTHGTGTITTLTVHADGTLVTDGAVSGVNGYSAGLIAD